MFNFHIHPNVWRFLGFVSCVVGFICYAFSPSFHVLFGRWTLFKILFYSILSSIFCVLTLFVSKSPQFSRGFLLKAHVGFLALMLTSLYSFYEDRSKEVGGQDDKGRRRNMLSLVSFAAFAFMSVSLSKQIQPDFDVGMSNFFLGCFIVSFMKMNIKIAIGVLALIYVLTIAFRSCWDYSQIADTVRAIMNNGDEEGRIEMPSLGNEGHEELDTIVEIQEETERDRIDELHIWFQAFRGSRGNDEHQMLIKDATWFLA